MGYDYTVYFQDLLERMDAALAVEFRPVLLDGVEPKLNDCHGNVDCWVTNHPETRAVRGWLFWPPDAAGRYLFMAHSVVEEKCELFDITPIDRNTPRDTLVFLKHLGTEEDFKAIRTICSQVLYPPMTQEEWRESQSPGPDETEIDEAFNPEMEMPGPF